MTSYTENDHRLEIDVTERVQATQHLTLNFDEAQTAIVSPDDPLVVYHRRKLQMSPAIRQGLGLEPAPLSVSLPVRRPSHIVLLEVDRT